MSKIKDFLIKNSEVILYLVFGGLTTAVSILSFWLFISLNINELIANIFSWILAVTFAFFTNKKLVFKNKTNSPISFWKQFSLFYLSRLFTLAVEELIIAIFITILNLNSMAVKITAQVLIIILNYLISKIFIFKQNKSNPIEEQEKRE